METIKSARLLYSDLHLGGSSHKEYRLYLIKNSSGYLVKYENGRIGSTLQSGTFTKNPVSEAEAIKTYEANYRRKVKDGYKPDGDASAAETAPAVSAAPGQWTEYPAELLEAITEEEAATYIKNDLYMMQVKLDGQRCQIAKRGDGTVVRFNKLGESKDLPKSVHDAVKALKFDDLVLDGELLGDRFGIFDVFRLEGENVAPLPYERRWLALNGLVRASDTPIKDTLFLARAWTGTADKTKGLAKLRKEKAEGAVFKLIRAPYAPGRNGQHKKFKFWKFCTCKVVGTGYKGHNSATLALLDKNDEWLEVGRASLIGKDKNIKVGSLVEIKFLYATKDNRLYQPGIKELRDDVLESECTMAAQLTKDAYKQTTVHD